MSLSRKSSWARGWWYRYELISYRLAYCSRISGMTFLLVSEATSAGLGLDFDELPEGILREICIKVVKRTGSSRTGAGEDGQMRDGQEEAVCPEGV